MTELEKLLAKIRNNPRHVRFEELDRVLRRMGFERRQPGSGSSHYIYFRQGQPPITVPYRQPHIKETYIKRAIAILEGERFDE